MALKTVRVPPDLESSFARAEEVVSSYFRARRDAPEQGTIEIFGERYVLVRAASLSVEFFKLVHDLYGEGRGEEADEFARNLLFDLAHSIGKSDAENFASKMGLEDPIARLSTGPVHFSHAGWAFVDIFPESRPSPDEGFFLVYDHPYAFESDAWIRAGRTSDFPVCIMNAGYSSGWCEASFGVVLVATEILCRARGDDSCRFIMGHPDHVEEHVARWLKATPHEPSARPGYQVPDFFARKRIEEQLRRAHDDLEARVHERTAELEHSTQRLQREMAERERAEKRLLQARQLESLGTLAGGLAHDFNTLLTAILGYGEQVEAALQAEHECQGDVQAILTAARRSRDLVGALLAFAQRQVTEPKVVDLNERMRLLQEMLARVVGSDVQLVAELGAGLWPVRVDPLQVDHVLVNLVLNARDALPAGGQVTISTANVEVPAEASTAHAGVSHGSYVVLSVADTGEGMPEAVQRRAFEPYFTTKGPGKGMGLGLATTHGIATQAGGHVTIESAPGHGTTLRLYLPRWTEPADPATPTPAPQPIAGRGATETVLLAEDEAMVRHLFERVLRMKGYEVISARDGEEALALASAAPERIALLVTDVVMPKMGGGELSQRLRERDPTLRVIYITGYSEDAVVERFALQPGARLLRKPITPSALVEAVRETLEA